MTLTDEQLAEIRGRLETAMSLYLSGIRSRIGGEPVLTLHGSDDKTYVFVLYGDGSDKQHAEAYATANSIAHAPTDIRALLDEVARQRKFEADALPVLDAYEHMHTRAVRAEAEVERLREIEAEYNALVDIP